MNVHQFSAKTLMGKEVALKDYEGQVLMIVNTASKCGFTPQYKELEELYQTYKTQGFAVLAFPSNNFGEQEPLEGEAIGAFCERNYGVSFPVFEKTDVRGKEAHPLFEFLAKKKLNGQFNATPKWNFQKYLVDKEGNVANYYYSTTSPTAKRVKKNIEKLLTD